MFCRRGRFKDRAFGCSRVGRISSFSGNVGGIYQTIFPRFPVRGCTSFTVHNVDAHSLRFTPSVGIFLSCAVGNQANFSSPLSHFLLSGETQKPQFFLWAFPKEFKQ